MDTLERLKIAEYVKRYPAELSGGQQQRVSFARMLAFKPSLLLFDKPLSNLDAKLRLEMRSEIKRFPDQTGATIIYVTHDQQEAMAISTRMAIMNRGELQQVDTPEGLYYHPINIFVASFIGNPKINLIPGETMAGSVPGKAAVRVGIVDIPTAALDLPAGHRDLPKKVVLGVRPEEIEVVSGSAPAAGQCMAYRQVQRVRHPAHGGRDPAGSTQRWRIPRGEMPGASHLCPGSGGQSPFEAAAGRVRRGQRQTAEQLGLDS